MYVDDILIISNDKTKEDKVVKNLSKDFTIMDLGEPKKYVGIDITRDCKNKIIKLN